MGKKKDDKLVGRLKERYDKALERRQKERAENQWFHDRVQQIFGAPRFVKTDFWCKQCKRDCSGTGFRQVCTVREWGPTAWYVGYCPNGHKMLRYITDKPWDPYYTQSHNLKVQRWQLRDADRDWETLA